MVKNKKRKSTLANKCDKKWSYLVKLARGNKCAYCGKKTYLNSHHLFTRTNYATRFDLDNGICLCSWHHTLNSNFSAHKTPLEFAEWIKELKGEERYDNLKRKSKGLRDGDYDKVIKYLDEQAEILTKNSQDWTVSK